MNHRTETIPATGFTLAAGSALAADFPCAAESGFDPEEAEVAALCDGVKKAIAEGYAHQGDPVGNSCRFRRVAGTRAAVQIANSTRTLLTRAKDTAAPQYMKYEEDCIEMPVESILAKVSVTQSSEKKAAPGPALCHGKGGTEHST